MASRGRGARAKGANFERKLAAKLKEDLKISAQRGLAQTRNGGVEVADVEMAHFHIEAKRHKVCQIKSAMKQAIADSENKSKMPVAITKDDRKPILVTMLYDDWVKLARAYIKKKK